MRKITALLVIVFIFTISDITIFADAKDSPNDYYKNSEFKKVADNIIKNYGGEEVISGIRYCRLDVSQTYKHDNVAYLYEVALFTCITETEPTEMKYRREDYYKGPKDTKRHLKSGINFNGNELITLPSMQIGTIGLEDVVNRFFDRRHSFVSAFSTRLKDERCTVAYKGKVKDKELIKDVYLVELTDDDPHALKERKTKLYYNPTTYLLEAISFEAMLPNKQTTEKRLVITEHKTAEIKSDTTKKSIKYISKISGKKWTESGYSQIKTKPTLEPFDEGIFNKE